MDITTSGVSATPFFDNESNYADFDDTTIAHARAEEQNEIITLNDATDKWKLNVGAAFRSQWQQIKDTLMVVPNENTDREPIDGNSRSILDPISLLEDKVSVVSILGDISTGKSFLARHLLTDTYDNDMVGGPVIINEREKTGPTTANINCYVGVSPKNSKTLVLDYEGGKSPHFPLMLHARQGLTHLIQSTETLQCRREAVIEYFPKLAYILSDVVILLGTEDLASTDYLIRCREFALKANNEINQIVHRPLLLIIQNKASLIQSVHSTVVTEKFFKTHGQGADALRSFFSDIKCFCLPHADQLQRTSSGILDGCEIFDQQMADVKELLATRHHENSERSLTHAQWLYLLQRVLPIVQSGKSVSIQTLLSEIVAYDGDKTTEIIMTCCLLLCNERTIHSPEWFANCSEFATRMVALFLAVKAHGQRELMSDRIIQEWCGKTLRQLSIKLDQFQPCEALYLGKGRAWKDKIEEQAVYCYQHKVEHESVHRTCQPVYGLSLWEELRGRATIDVWLGDFVSSTNSANNNGIVSENIVVDVSKKIRRLMDDFRQNPETIYHLFIDLFRPWCHERPTKIFSRICFCTLRANEFLCDLALTQSNSVHQLRRQRQRKLLSEKNKAMVKRIHPLDNLISNECQTCYQKLVDAWNRPRISTPLTLSQTDDDSPQCITY